MSIFSRYPYTDFHRLNADWILDKVTEAITSVTEALGLVRQSAADAAAAAAAAEQAVDGSVRYDRAQELTEQQMLQARNNINTVERSVVARLDLALSDLNTEVAALRNTGFVRYDQAQALNANQQTTVRNNIGAASSTDVSNLSANLAATNIALNNTRGIAQAAQARADIALIYDEQELTQAQQAQARANIGAAAEGSAPAHAGAVLYDQAQSLTGAQQNQARGNIGALAQTDPNIIHSLELVDDAAAGNEGDELTVTLTSVVDQSKVLLAGQQSENVILSGLAAPTDPNDAANKSYVDGRIIANAPLLVQFTGSDDTGNAACNRTFNEVRNAMFNNRAVRMVCVVGQMQYDLIPTRYTGSTQSVGGHVILVEAITNTGALDAYITISCSISPTDHVSVQINDSM